MENIFKHFWIILLAFAIYNGFQSRKRVDHHIQENPSLKKGYDKFIMWHTIIGCIPILIIGIGIILGQLKDIFGIFDIHSDKSIIKLFYAYVSCIWIFGFYWIYFQDGAEFLERHKGMYQINIFGKVTNPTARQTKLYYPLTLLAAFMFYFFMQYFKIE